MFQPIIDSVDLSTSVLLNARGVIDDVVSSESLKPLFSDADPELLFHFHFNSPVRLDGFLIRVPDEENLGVSRAPSRIFFFKNAPHLSFADCQDSHADHQVDLEDSDYIVDRTYPGVRVATIPFKAFKWSNTSSVTVFIESNVERSDCTVLCQIMPMGQGASQGGLQMSRLDEVKEQAKKKK
ncbi:hypothetical protein P9112_008145 [Eukaryota sp. TZLM1-RC]